MNSNIIGSDVSTNWCHHYVSDKWCLAIWLLTKWYCAIILAVVIFTVQAPTSGLYYKQVTIVIYDCNDSGQYYKTTITIVIDDPSLS